MTNEQKQKRRDYQREYYKKYYAAKKLNNKIIDGSDNDNENNKIIDGSNKIIDNEIIDDSDNVFLRFNKYKTKNRIFFCPCII